MAQQNLNHLSIPEYGQHNATAPLPISTLIDITPSLQKEARDLHVIRFRHCQMQSRIAVLVPRREFGSASRKGPNQWRIATQPTLPQEKTSFSDFM